MRSSLRIFILIGCFLITLLAFGTTGYYCLEKNWSLLDAFYMTVITIATVGFGETHTLSSQGRIFTITLIFMGLFAISMISAQAAKMLIDNEIKSIFGRGKMLKEIKKLTKHYIICGFGRIGSTICSELTEQGVPFVVIEKDDQLADEAEKSGALVLKGDATADAILKEVGIETAAGVVAALNSDAYNLFITLAARELNPMIKIIARGEEHGVEARMRRAGADIVVSPLKLGGRQIARLITETPKTSSEAARNRPDSPDAYILEQIACSDNTCRTIEDMVAEVQGLLAVVLAHADGTVELSPDMSAVPASSDSVLLWRSKDSTP